jgi:anaerobic magnesium-protoporphyrin IX monomethyl ester cyclase
MKVTLVFPPQFDPTLPHLALPCLTAVLNRAGHQVVQRDVNLELYDEILTAAVINQSLHHIHEQREAIFQRGCPIETLDAVLATGPVVAQLVEYAKNTLRNPEQFHIYERYSGSLKIIDQALLIFSLPFYPTRFSLYGYVMEKPPYSTVYVTGATEDELHNPFIHLYEKSTLPSLLAENSDLIGISISYEEQLVPGLTLARLIKEKQPGTHIVIGGNILTRHREALCRNLRLFRYFDSVIVYEGETALLELVNRLENGLVLDGIPNLYYKEGESIHAPSSLFVEDLKTLPTPDFSGLPIGGYFSPFPILPAYLSRGCYWRQCAFCTSPDGQDKIYRNRPAQQVSDDLAVLRSKWQVACFAFVDEAVPPRNLEKLADRLLSLKDRGFSWISWARLDPGFTPPVLEKMQKSGCVALLFGLESACERVLAMMQKGINLKAARKILLDSSAMGIINHAGILIGFPSESEQEALDTVRFVLEHYQQIQSIGLSLFNLDRDSRVMMDLRRYNVEPVINPAEDLASAFDYRIGDRSREEKRRLYDAITGILEEAYPYHLLSLHRFIYPDQGSHADINACTIDQELSVYENELQRKCRVTSAYRKLADLEHQLSKGDLYNGNRNSTA